MEPPAKKSRRCKLLPSKKLELLDLNDDCILHIFGKLSPTDLCSASFTCQRMQRLAFDHFPRQYPDELITVRQDYFTNRPYIFTEGRPKKYRKYFAKCIRNVRIESIGTHDPLQDLFDFVNTECSAVLRSLHLDIQGLLKKANVRVIENRLEHLWKLSVRSPHSRLDIHDLLLQHCKKIETFQIWTSGQFDTFWMMHKYPTLKTLHTWLVKTFMQLNPQIRNVSSSGVDLTTSIWRHHPNKIERMRVQVNHDPSAFLTALLEFSKRRRFAWLDLHLKGYMTKDYYKSLTSVNGLQPIRSLRIYLCDIPDEPIFMSSLKSLVQLSVSFRSGYSQYNEMLDIISRQLPSLEHLDLNVGASVWIFRDFIMQFARNSPTMRSLSFPCCCPNHFQFHPNDLVALNDVRSKIPLAHPLVIRIGYENCYERPKFVHPANAVISVMFTVNGDPNLWKCQKYF